MKYHSHFGVYAIIPDATNTKVLLIKKALGCYTGLYDLPGGGMEPHELLEEALYREVHEETGCMAGNLSQLATFSVLYPYKKDGADFVLRHLGTIYKASITGTPRETSDGTDDSHGCVWVPVSEISEKNSTPFVIDAVKALKK